MITSLAYLVKTEFSNYISQKRHGESSNEYAFNLNINLQEVKPIQSKTKGEQIKEKTKKDYEQATQPKILNGQRIQK